MSTQQMREALADRYSKKFVARMKDDQVIATYKRLQRNGKI